MIPLAVGTTVSVAANSTATVSVNKSYEFLPKGRVVLAARSATKAHQVNLLIGGVQIARAMDVPFFGATGGLSIVDHTFVDQRVNGGRIEFELVNTTGGAVNIDYYLGFEPQ